jgi:putative oxidoreductase
MNKLVAWSESHRELWLDFVRIYLGLGLLARGILLAFNIRTDVMMNLLQSSSEQWLMSGALLHYVTAAHLVGGALLTVGLFTRIAAAVQLPVLAGAVFFVHRQDGLFAMGQSLEFSALVLFLLAVMAVAGAGPLSVDATMADRRSPSHEPATQI